MDEQVKEQEKEPFFARFLEQQDSLQVQSDVKAGGRFPIVTMKYPSDDDEGEVS